MTYVYVNDDNANSNCDSMDIRIYLVARTPIETSVSIILGNTALTARARVIVSMREGRIFVWKRGMNWSLVWARSKCQDSCIMSDILQLFVLPLELLFIPFFFLYIQVISFSSLYISSISYIFIFPAGIDDFLEFIRVRHRQYNIYDNDFFMSF